MGGESIDLCWGGAMELLAVLGRSTLPNRIAAPFGSEWYFLDGLLVVVNLGAVVTLCALIGLKQ
jgi:hypothetical protein